MASTCIAPLPGLRLPGRKRKVPPTSHGAEGFAEHSAPIGGHSSDEDVLCAVACCNEVEDELRRGVTQLDGARGPTRPDRSLGAPDVADRAGISSRGVGASIRGLHAPPRDSPAESPSACQTETFAFGLAQASDSGSEGAALVAPTLLRPLKLSKGPAPPVPRRAMVLVAKCLTNSDASSGRVILPRVSVETNLPFVLGYRHYALEVRDTAGHRHTFVIKSWANGTEHRRVFVLEQAAEFLRTSGMGVGDTIGICAGEDGGLVVECNTEAVRRATVCARFLPAGAGASPRVLAPPPGSSGGGVPLAGGAPGRCTRSVHCSKHTGHPGFCSGPKAATAAAAAAARAARQRPQQQYSALAYTPRHHPASSSCRGGGEATADGSASGDEAATTAGLVAPSGSLARGSDASSPLRPALRALRELADGDAAALPPGLHAIADIPIGLVLSKELTAYDLSSCRVVMPAAEVEGGVPNAPDTDLLTLAAVDESQGWQFLTLRAWASVAGRRGYLLEGGAAFLERRGAAAGDVLSVYRDSRHAPPRIEVHGSGDGQGVKAPGTPDSSWPFSSLPLLLLHGAGDAPGSGGGDPSPAASNEFATCHRTSGCTKHSGHQGFCSGHKGFRRRDVPGSTPTAAAARQRAAAARRVLAAAAGRWEESDDDYTPSSKRARRAAAAQQGSWPACGGGGGGDPLLSLLSLLDGSAEGAAATETDAA